jgi:hypothetical protein
MNYVFLKVGQTCNDLIARRTRPSHWPLHARITRRAQSPRWTIDAEFALRALFTCSSLLPEAASFTLWSSVLCQIYANYHCHFLTFDPVARLDKSHKANPPPVAIEHQSHPRLRHLVFLAKI